MTGKAEDTINKQQMLFGINQGAVYPDIRIEHAKRISEMDLDGYAVGGLAVGETHEEMYYILEETVPYLPKDKLEYSSDILSSDYYKDNTVKK